MPLLEVKNLSKSFGKLQAVVGLDFSIDKGEIRGLIGPNGAGKTTVFNLLTGFYAPTAGQIVLKGEDITGLESHSVANKGLTRSFQQTFLFMESTVLENILVGFHMKCKAGPLKEFLHTASARRYDEDCRQRSLEIMEFMGLSPYKDELAGNLSHGHQRSLGVSMALACDPILLLLDEPVTGMNPTETRDMVERIRTIRDRGITIILVEHSMRVVMDVCDKITVINYGRKIAEGLPVDIRKDSQVIEAYLGKEEEEDGA